MKRTSSVIENFNVEEVITKDRKPRGSKFDMMSRASIDGKIIKSDAKKKAEVLEGSK